VAERDHNAFCVRYTPGVVSSDFALKTRIRVAQVLKTKTVISSLLSCCSLSIAIADFLRFRHTLQQEP